MHDHSQSHGPSGQAPLEPSRPSWPIILKKGKPRRKDSRLGLPPADWVGVDWAGLIRSSYHQHIISWGCYHWSDLPLVSTLQRRELFSEVTCESCRVHGGPLFQACGKLPRQGRMPGAYQPAPYWIECRYIIPQSLVCQGGIGQSTLP